MNDEIIDEIIIVHWDRLCIVLIILNALWIIPLILIRFGFIGKP